MLIFDLQVHVLTVTHLWRVNEHNQYTLTETNSTNSLCLHVTAFANSSGNIAIVTSAFSPWQSQQEPCAIKYGGQTWLDEAWLMAEKHSHRSLIRCKEIVCIYAETVKQEEGIVHKPSPQSDKSLSLKCWMLPKVVENRRQNAKSTSGRELLCAWSIRTQGHSAKPASQRGTDENPRENENANRFSNNTIWWYITKIAISVL